MEYPRQLILICTLCPARCLLIRNPRTFQFFRIPFGLHQLSVGFGTCPLFSSTLEGNHLVEQCNPLLLGLVPPICQQGYQGPSVRQIVDSQDRQELPCPRLPYALQGRETVGIWEGRWKTPCLTVPEVWRYCRLAVRLTMPWCIP